MPDLLTNVTVSLKKLDGIKLVDNLVSEVLGFFRAIFSIKEYLLVITFTVKTQNDNTALLFDQVNKKVKVRELSFIETKGRG